MYFRKELSNKGNFSGWLSTGTSCRNHSLLIFQLQSPRMLGIPVVQVSYWKGLEWWEDDLFRAPPPRLIYKSRLLYLVTCPSDPDLISLFQYYCLPKARYPQPHFFVLHDQLCYYHLRRQLV